MQAAEVFSLKGRVVMITGASSGLGERMAEVAAANGARVVLVSRRQTVLDAVRARIAALGGEALVAVADVTDDASMRAAFDAAEAAYGVVDVFVANAGLPGRAHPLEVDRKKWREVMSTDLDAVFFGCQEAARRLIAAGRPGSIITVASIAGLLTATRLSPYAAAKAGLLHATRLLAAELGPRGIRVNAIAPGYILTSMTEDYLASPDGKALAERVPLRRLGVPSDIDGAFLLLASGAGGLMTGVTIAVDSGTLLMGL